MSCSPQPSQIGCREVSMMRTAVFRLWGHDSTGPSGELAQSNARMRSPISPPPDNQFAALGGCAERVGSLVTDLSSRQVRTRGKTGSPHFPCSWFCLLYTSDAADERSSVDLGGR